MYSWILHDFHNIVHRQKINVCQQIKYSMQYDDEHSELRQKYDTNMTHSMKNKKQ